MFYSQVILAKKGPLAKVWLAAHWGDKKLARPQIFATDISQSCTDIMNPSVPLALRLSGHLLLGVVRIYSRKVRYVLHDCTEAMLKLQMAFAKQSSSNNPKGGTSNFVGLPLDANGNPLGPMGGSRELLHETDANAAHQLVANFGEFDQVHVVEGFCLPLPEDNEWILADESGNAGGPGGGPGGGAASVDEDGSRDPGLLLAAHQQQGNHPSTHNTNINTKINTNININIKDDDEEEAWAPFDPDNEDEEDDLPNNSRVSDIEIVRAANDSLLSEDQVSAVRISYSSPVLSGLVRLACLLLLPSCLVLYVLLACEGAPAPAEQPHKSVSNLSFQSFLPSFLL
jgi:cohesin complex subunit SCC1